LKIETPSKTINKQITIRKSRKLTTTPLPSASPNHPTGPVVAIMNDRLGELRATGRGGGGGAGAAAHQDIEMGRVDTQPQFMNDFFTDVEAVKVRCISCLFT
jgi:hypothetical protein